MMLPPVQERTELIEVVRITDPMRHLSASNLVGDDVAIWEAAQVSDALTLISSAPDSELRRRFTPGWGIRAHGATDLLFQIAFCFHCHGARLWGPGVPVELDGIHGFDPDSPPALELLQRFRGSAPGRLKRHFRRN
ncbi:hypothetical protein [Streptomyces sp. SID2888]|uniref:hypothetical protein n=1 Tax=Streptomyces sp. SID2888 TaxID=2690256 RepID=UPI00136F0895|nr:hypothetical protein [Streptomyces sp. SID2888]MYV44279.1 hypothetical protein [Streptomyces sp. SID2888]MYV50602.1 hypothetical protein [Streptomyces sp. SID2888]